MACNFFIVSATNWVQRKSETMKTTQTENEFLDMIAAQKRIIYKVCYIYAKDQDDLNDLFQETVLNLWKSYPHFRGDSKLTTWVYRIAMNTCITFLRRSNTRPQTIPMDGLPTRRGQQANARNSTNSSTNWENWNAR